MLNYLLFVLESESHLLFIPPVVELYKLAAATRCRCSTSFYYRPCYLSRQS